ncbi:hypothetical protein GOC29_29830 [Sinorhizobium meliloti]|nr:hypothetical protein [Sinorhizobium meliloti]
MENAQERFAGASSLAVSHDEFWRNYPALARDVARYTSFLKSKGKRTKYVLAPRLFVGGIEADERFHPLRDFLRNPTIGNSEDFADILPVALKASYERLQGSGFYSPAIALEHSRNAIGVFRWLGVHGNIYPKVPAKLDLKPENRKGPRKNRCVDALQPMEMEEIASILGETFIEDLKVYRDISARGTQKVLGLRYLMACIKFSPSGDSDKLLAALSGRARVMCDAATVKAVIDGGEAVLTKSKAFAPATINGWMRDCGLIFEHLTGLPGRSYPHYSRRYKRFKYTPPEGTSLASLDFPETRGLLGSAKLRASMDLVRDAAMEVVRKHVSFFNAAAPARSPSSNAAEDLPRSQRSALRTIGVVVEAEVRSLEQTGSSQFSKSGRRLNIKNANEAMKALEDPALWRDAGLGVLVPDFEVLAFQQIMMLVMACIGATKPAVLASKIVFCCETGWNRQPIDDIPREVYQFRLSDDAGVASASFVQVFKNRAGHLVQTLLEHSELRGGRRSDAMAVWEEAERERSWGDFDQRCLLSYTSPAFEALELLRPLMEPLDALSNDERVHDRYFKSVSVLGVTCDQRAITSVFKEGTLSTAGLTFRLIRKSYLQLTLREVGSVEALRSHAGHAGTGVLLSHYLNSPDIRRELEQSTRFFQNAVQSLVVAEVGRPLQLLLPEVDHEWFYNLARVSGVASAVGYGVSTPVAGAPAFNFRPSDENVRALLALRMALDAEETVANPRRWALIGVPLCGFVTAVVARLETAGMGRLIKRITESLAIDVREGRVVLPILNLNGC